MGVPIAAVRPRPALSLPALRRLVEASRDSIATSRCSCRTCEAATCSMSATSLSSFDASSPVVGSSSANSGSSAPLARAASSMANEWAWSPLRSRSLSVRESRVPARTSAISGVDQIRARCPGFPDGDDAGAGPLVPGLAVPVLAGLRRVEWRHEIVLDAIERYALPAAAICRGSTVSAHRPHNGSAAITGRRWRVPSGGQPCTEVFTSPVRHWRPGTIYQFRIWHLASDIWR
jgi:hypothetical protein